VVTVVTLMTVICGRILGCGRTTPCATTGRELRVNKVRRVGNGWLGRAATRGRMRSHDHGYVGSVRVLGQANRRRVASWVIGKAWS
jgi:hypothetical protein